MNVMDNPHFRKFLYHFGYAAPARDTATKLIDKLYDDMVNAQYKRLEAATAVALTTDAATSIAGHNYQGVTAHFISDKWTLESVVLALTPAPGSHTAEYVKDLVTRSLSRWNLTEKAFSLTTDGVANMLSAVDQLKRAEVVDESVRCVAHTIHLAVTAALDNDAVVGILKRAQAIITFFQKSPHGTNVLQLIQMDQPPERLEVVMKALREQWNKVQADEDPIPDEPEDGKVEETAELRSNPLKVLSAVATRWSSHYLAISRLVQLQPQIDEALRRVDRMDLILNKDEWTTLREITFILKPFANATKKIEGEKYVTLSFVWPLFGNLYHYLFRGKSATLKDLPDWSKLKPASRAVRHALIHELSHPTRFSAPSRAMVFAAILDIRHHQLSFAGEADRLRHIHDFKAFGEAFFRDHPIDVAAVPMDHPADDMMDALFDIERHEAVAMTFSQEVDKYLQINNHPSRTDPLLWWKENQLRFPRLAVLAKMYLCIPCTSAPSERLFSHLNLVVSKKRTRMLPVRVEKHAMVRVNMISNPSL